MAAVETNQSSGAMARFRFGRRAIYSAPSYGRRQTSRDPGEPFDGAGPASRLQYPDGSYLVRTGESVLMGRTAAPKKTGNSVGESSAHRRGAHQPQSLRPS